MTLEQKIKAAEEQRIHLLDELLGKEIAGIYGFFAVKENEDAYCFYIGRATNMVGRLFGCDGGHLHLFLKEDYEKLVPQKIKNYLDLGYDIEIRLLDNFEDTYRDTDFSKAAHRLALAEYQQIVKYQELGQCLDQFPDGMGAKEKNYWESRYKEES